MENSIDLEIYLNTLNSESSELTLENLWDKMQDGFTFIEIENALLFILLIRFVILTLKYNLKTSFYITCIGFVAGYIWYQHLISVVSTYETVLLKMSFFRKLGLDSLEVQKAQKLKILETIDAPLRIRSSNPGQFLYDAVIQGITAINSQNGLRYYIDPISLLISKLPESSQTKIFPLYYEIYTDLIPNLFKILSGIVNQYKDIFIYTGITRLGKRYCPYLIRWHWTLVIMLGLLDRPLIEFLARMTYFREGVLVPERNFLQESMFNNSSRLEYLESQIKIFTEIQNMLLAAYISFIIFALFHAIWGQYFYLPIFVSATEAHVGPRPINSIYGGGLTAWQDEVRESLSSRVIPKVWFGWFGRGTKNKGNWNFKLKLIFKKVSKVVKSLLSVL